MGGTGPSRAGRPWRTVITSARRAPYARPQVRWARALLVEASETPYGVYRLVAVP